MSLCGSRVNPGRINGREWTLPQSGQSLLSVVQVHMCMREKWWWFLFIFVLAGAFFFLLLLQSFRTQLLQSSNIKLRPGILQESSRPSPLDWGCQGIHFTEWAATRGSVHTALVCTSIYQISCWNICSMFLNHSSTISHIFFYIIFPSCNSESTALTALVHSHLNTLSRKCLVWVGRCSPVLQASFF